MNNLTFSSNLTVQSIVRRIVLSSKLHNNLVFFPFTKTSKTSISETVYYVHIFLVHSKIMDSIL